MKLGPATKSDKRNTSTSNKFEDDVRLAICDVNVIFQFMVNLEQSPSRILDTWSVKLTFLLIVTMYLTKTENRTKKSQTQFSYYCFE